MTGGIRSFAVLFTELVRKYDADSASVSWIPGIVALLQLGFGPFSNALSLRWGHRCVILAGGLISSTGFLISAFMPSVIYLYVTYGVLVGLGFGLGYSPCFVTLSVHFSKYLGLACGIVGAAGSLGVVCMPILLRYFINEYGLMGALVLLCGLHLHMCVFACLLGLGQLMCTADGSELEGSDTQESLDSLDSGITLNCKQKLPDTASSDQQDNVAAVACNNDAEKSAMLCAAGNGSLRSFHYNCNKSMLDKNLSIRSHVSCEESSVQLKRGSLLSFFASISNITQVSVQSLSHLEAHQVGEECQKTPSRRPLFMWSLLRNPIFLLIMISQLLGMMGLPVGFINIAPFASEQGISPSDVAYIVSMPAIADIFARLLICWVADHTHKYIVYCVCLVVSAVIAFVAPLLSTFMSLMVASVVFSCFAGGFFSLTSVVLVEFLGVEMLTYSLGISSLFSGISQMMSLPISGMMRDATGSWTCSWLFSGSVVTLSAVFIMIVPCVKKCKGQRPLSITLETGSV